MSFFKRSDLTGLYPRKAEISLYCGAFLPVSYWKNTQNFGILSGMLNTLLSQPVFFTSAALILLGLALYLAPNSYLKKYLYAKASQNGKAGVFFPLISSIIVSFVLTLIFKFFQI